MKNLKLYIPILFLTLLYNCNSNKNNNAPSSIEIGNYRFNFESTFTLEELQGIDSYVGNINGHNVSLFFDYGWYTSPSKNLSLDDYDVFEDKIEGHFRQIVKPKDALKKYTKIHLYKYSDELESPFGFNSLTVSTNNLSLSDQEMILKVFNNVEIIE